jgi:uncharacterized membrane protein YwaF
MSKKDVYLFLLVLIGTIALAVLPGGPSFRLEPPTLPDIMFMITSGLTFFSLGSSLNSLRSNKKLSDAMLSVLLAVSFGVLVSEIIYALLCNDRTLSLTILMTVMSALSFILSRPWDKAEKADKSTHMMKSKE